MATTEATRCAQFSGTPSITKQNNLIYIWLLSSIGLSFFLSTAVSLRALPGSPALTICDACFVSPTVSKRWHFVSFSGRGCRSKEPNLCCVPKSKCLHECCFADVTAELDSLAPWSNLLCIMCAVCDPSKWLSNYNVYFGSVSFLTEV